jgi:hypothetical protein
MSGPLALVVRTERTYPGGDFVDYDVCDSRSGEALATRSELSSANDVAAYLNATYPTPAVWPAHDTLVHEIVMCRVSEDACLCLDTVLMLGRLRQHCPAYLPIGPGWDHIYEEVERNAGC